MVRYKKSEVRNAQEVKFFNRNGIDLENVSDGKLFPKVMFTLLRTYTIMKC